MSLACSIEGHRGVSGRENERGWGMLERNRIGSELILPLPNPFTNRLAGVLNDNNSRIHFNFLKLVQDDF